MASRVNIRFVIVLSAVLAMVFVGVAGAFFYVKLRSGDRYVGLGDAAMARGDIKAATKFYSNAVGKEPNNVAWLTKWRDALTKKVPESFSEYQDDYKWYIAILRSLASTKRTDTAAHRDFLNAILDQCETYSRDRGSWQSLIDTCETAMGYYGNEKPAELRAYRGIAIVAIADSGAEVKPDQLDMARQDLEAALTANPRAAGAARSLASLHAYNARLARQEGNTERAKTESAAGAKVLADAVTADPGSPIANVAKLLYEAAEAEASVDKTQEPTKVAAARASIVSSLQPKAADLTEKLKSADPALLTPDVVTRFMGLVIALDTKAGLDQSKAVIERAMSTRPKDPDFMALRSQVTVLKGDAEPAIAQYQEIIDLKTLPVSWQGIKLFDLQRRAMFAQTNLVLALASDAKTEDDRKPLMERVAKYRQQLAANVAERSPELLFIDAKTKLLQGDPRGAQRLFAEFVKAPGNLEDQTLEATLLMARIGMQTNELGLALENIRKAAAARPDSVEILLTRGQLELANNNRKEALACYTQVLEMAPDNAVAKEQKQILEASSGKLDELKDLDAVMRRMIQADRLQQGTKEKLGDDRAALAWLEAGVEESNADPRLMMAIARMRSAAGDNEGAMKAVQAGLDKHPDDEQLKQIQTRLTASGSLEGMLALIENSPGTPVDKQINRAQAYLSYGKTAEADAAYAEAAKLAPEDPRVLEWRFLQAIAKGDTAEATKLADIAAKTDADRSDGDTFKARILISQKNYRDAATVLQRAVTRGNANQAVHRLLGATQLELGRGTDAVDSFRRAQQLNPGDVATTKLLLNALVRLDQRDEALATARKNEPFCRRDPEFVNMWLDLESTSGDTAVARQRREQIYASNPKDAGNAAALATMYIEAREWDKARALLDAVRKTSDSIKLVTVDARWYTDSGKLEPTKALDAARVVFVDYIQKLSQQEGALNAEPYLAFGEFMLLHGRPEWGIAAIRQAARFQDPKTHSVDLALGDVLLARGMFPEAETAYRAVIDAGVPDPDLRIHKRLIESLIQQGKSAEAEKMFVDLGDRADADVELMAQRAQLAHQSGDLRKCREILDRAVSKFPEEPLPYLRRARLNMLMPGLDNDAIADLGTAIRLRPNFWQAYRARATIYLAQGKPEDAMRDWRMAVDTNPSLDPLRLGLIDLYLSQNRENEAVEVADAGLKGRTTDAKFVTSIAQRFIAAEPPRWQRAIKYYRQLWELVQNPGTTVAYVNVLLSATPPGLAEADAALAIPALKTNDSPPLLLSRAALRRKQNRMEPAIADAVAAIGLCGDDANALNTWFGTMRLVFKTTREQMQVLQAVRPLPKTAPWVQFFMARTQLEDAAMRTQAISTLQQLAAPGPSKELRVAAASALAEAYFNESKFEDCLAITLKGLEASPDDAGLNNNAACYLSENLNRAQDALRYAERAATGAPGDHRVVDTLASVNWKLGNKPKAIEVLNVALRLAPTEADKAAWSMKLTRWYLESGDKKGAAKTINSLREMINDNPKLAQEIRSEFERLVREVEQAP